MTIWMSTTVIPTRLPITRMAFTIIIPLRKIPTSTAMATTVLRVHLLSKISGLVFLTLFSCEHRGVGNFPVLHIDSVEARSLKGLLYVNDRAFSGTLYNSFPASSDTSWVKTFIDGKEDGQWKQFYSNGEIRETRHFTQGKKTGEYRAWWPDGRLQLVYHFTDGEYEGTCREWNNKGLLIKEMNYHQGYEEGPQKLWYNNGTIKSNYVMKNGRRYGLLGTKNCTNVTDSIF